MHNTDTVHYTLTHNDTVHYTHQQLKTSYIKGTVNALISLYFYFISHNSLNIFSITSIYNQNKSIIY